ncbi:uncharacterized protein LDX57_000899 [Aspergillus melleus]|uniref:uncharacterized protein n=1 Tax=Aspergillus melleus TaxID=138277 RepID=UPI001E8E008C|nr:uncharacterized protein LDX57_000899 [Aspergillus melleus]KAH8423145.1 hypothetical protein LDX57_000899 [Aspergillus melleus]
MSSPVRFDHVLIELSTRDFEAPPSWLTDNFTILEGGTHAGGLTRNNLIPLPDTTYIELLNIITPPASHEDWTSKYPGDFALTTLPPVTATENYNRLVSALKSPNGGDGGDGTLGINVTYKPPIPGGRKTPSGEDVKWEIVKAEVLSTQPEGTGRGAQYGPTTVPFFCHDVTDRKVRVPRVPESGHPSGVVGIKAIEVVVPGKEIDAFAELYTAVLGVEERTTEGGDREFALRAPGTEEETGVVRVRASRTEEDERYLKERGVGVSALVFRVQGDGELRLPIAGYYLQGR